MATRQFTKTQTAEVEPTDCPHCDGTIEYDDQALQCVDCGYAPRHAAD